MDRKSMVSYVLARPEAVVATLGPGGEPQAAYLPVTATDRGEFVFDARRDSRKVANLLRDPRVALVIGGRDGTTLQVQGVADLPTDAALERCAAAYVGTFPEFADSVRSESIVVVRVRPDWARFGDYRGDTGSIVEVRLDAVA
ncbi:hypothetical protein GE115_00755 [Agromyces sp. CFH 90414]|uniref:Pyridoxamine 5'-phosphate oxidase N-terminal domain-containing protein n=1 Tax=Agromyces agglutinans TaxID=2662258 RepID=A0A6I2F6C2_9MICO|nr:pyridoxamine 5'-phosphate oxidase family protein [Agromyces agglutinans]MRG58410.1 hypothetical protein [Agromyces agglutinans]